MKSCSMELKQVSSWRSSKVGARRKKRLRAWGRNSQNAKRAGFRVAVEQECSGCLLAETLGFFPG